MHTIFPVVGVIVIAATIWHTIHEPLAELARVLAG